MKRYATHNSNWKCHIGTTLPCWVKTFATSKCIISLFYPEAFVKQACLEPLPLNSSALTNSLPEKSQGLAEAATCLIELKCQQEEKKKKKKARQKGDGASDLFRECYPINELSVTIRKLGQGGKTRLVLSFVSCLDFDCNQWQNEELAQTAELRPIMNSTHNSYAFVRGNT